MKYYLIDDDIQIIRALSKIIQTDFNREIIGYETSPEKALEVLHSIRPDIIIIDYLMPKIDGISVLKEIQDLSYPHKVIMLSQVNDKEMMSKAYVYKINYFIHKPLNKIEIESILTQLESQILQDRKIESIASLFQADSTSHSYQPLSGVSTQSNQLKKILSDLGIAGERGSKDIINVCTYLINDPSLSVDEAIDYYVNALKKNQHYSKKIIQQRMRRSITKGLSNMAYIGIEDLNTDIFVHYANALFQYDSVIKEINKVKGKMMTGGHVNLNSFIESLMILSAI